MVQTAAQIWRKYDTDGVPASGAHKPSKADIVPWGTMLETMLNIGAGFAFSTLAAISADLVHPDSTFAIVYGDSTAANNGMYRKSGNSGVGSWVRVGDLPTSLLRLTVTGGTGNAIVATAPETPTLPGAKLYLLTPDLDNSGAVTIAVNGASAVAIKSALGSSMVTGSLIAGSPVLMCWSTDHYQLLVSVPVDASGVLNDVLDARDDAEAAATSATASASALGNQVHQYDTRALAIAATIPGGVNFIRTLAYDSNFIENSGATFKRVPAGTAFTDTWPLTGTIAGGSGYVNGTYYGILLSGSATGAGIGATITVSGGAVTAVDFRTQPGSAYKVGDVLTCSNALLGGTGSGFTYTIATISSPLASFVNAVDSSRWQYIQSKGCVHVNEFGANPDWFNTDSGTTNNFPAIQAAMFYAVRGNFTGAFEDNGGHSGDTVKVGVGSYMLLHTDTSLPLIIPNGVRLEGTNASASTLKFSDSWAQGTHCIAIGNPNAHFANFNSELKSIRVFFKRGITATNATYMIYSNNTQDGGGVDDVAIFTGQRGGIFYEIGYGGASTVKFHRLNINVEGHNAAFRCNVGTTIVDCRHWSLGAPSSGTNDTVNAIELVGTGGMYNFEGIHMEGYPNGFSINLQTGNNPQASFKNITGGFNLAYVFTLVSTNMPGNCSFERCQRNNGLATGLVLNGQSGGTSRLTDILPKDGIVFFNP